MRADQPLSFNLHNLQEHKSEILEVSLFLASMEVVVTMAGYASKQLISDHGGSIVLNVRQ